MGQSQSRTDKLNFIDGLKGTGALIVYLCHFAYAFYYSLYSLDRASLHTASGIEIAVGKSPLNILYNGNFAVHLFFAASGFVQMSPRVIPSSPRMASSRARICRFMGPSSRWS